MAEARAFPFDWGELSKGSWLETDVLERATYLKRTDNNFRLKVMSVMSEIRERTGILCRSENDRVRLMTDVEAYQWNYEQSQQAVRKLTRAARRCADIDMNQLEDSDRKAAEHCQIAIVSTAAAARREQAKHTKLFGLMKPDAPLLGDGT